MDTNIQPILEKSLAAERLDFDDCLTLFKSHDLLAFGARSGRYPATKAIRKATSRTLLTGTLTIPIGATSIVISVPFIAIARIQMPMSWNAKR